MRIINIIIAICSVLAIIQTLRLFVREQTPIRSTIVWLFLLISIGVFGLFPGLLDVLMRGVMMENRMFFLCVVAILILYALFFTLSTENAKQKHKTNRLAQEIAILRHELEESIKSSKGSGKNDPGDS